MTSALNIPHKTVAIWFNSSALRKACSRIPEKSIPSLVAEKIHTLFLTGINPTLLSSSFVDLAKNITLGIRKPFVINWQWLMGIGNRFPAWMLKMELFTELETSTSMWCVNARVPWVFFVQKTRNLIQRWRRFPALSCAQKLGNTRMKIMRTNITSVGVLGKNVTRSNLVEIIKSSIKLARHVNLISISFRDADWFVYVGRVRNWIKNYQKKESSFNKSR